MKPVVISSSGSPDYSSNNLSFPHQLLITVFLCVTLSGVCGQEPEQSNAGLDVETIQEFDRLDRNGSGTLDELEFVHSEIANRLRAAGGEREAVNRILAKIDRDGDARISLFEFAQSQHNRNARILDVASSNNFVKMDLDQDGLIALGEYTARADSRPGVFERIDLNDSGVIGPFEWVQALRTEYMSAELATKFARLDQDDSGAIDQREFANGTPPQEIAGAFAGIDLNGNQEVAPPEFAKALAAPEPRLAVPADLLRDFEQLDRNRDKAISRREFGRTEFAQRAPGTRLVDLVFSKADTNNDKELSLAEFGKHRQRQNSGGPKGKGKSKGFKAR